MKELAGRALSQYERAQQAMKRGDWQKYGEALKNLENTLKEMKKGE